MPAPFPAPARASAPDPLLRPIAASLPGGQRPLAGVTLLVVEDSRYAAEAVRMLALRSGARIRRADSLRSAERHLAVYRPTVALVDLGLPDGSGADLILRLSAATPRLPAIIATSGDPQARTLARAAGADGFLAKPVVSLGEFQDTLVRALGRDEPAARPRAVHTDCVLPDPLAYREDLAHVAELLTSAEEPRALGYAVQFLRGVAQSAGDRVLLEAAERLAEHLANATPRGSEIARIAGLVADRLGPRSFL